MAGRWRMASVQIAFAAMPALVYLFAGLSIAGWRQAISLGTLVAFTTLQTRLFFPVQCLLSVSVDVQSSLALFERVFEYLDLPVEVVGARRGVEPRSGRRSAATSAFEGVSFGYGEEAEPDARATSTSTSRPGRRWRWSARPAPARRRSPTCSPASTSRQSGRVTIDGVDLRDLSHASLAATVGLVSQETYLFHASIAREPALREARSERRRGRARGPRSADRRDDRRPPGRLRHRRRRARLPLLGRREAAHRDRPRDPPQPADPDPRRGDQRPRHRDRARGPARARRARQRPDDDRHRPPPLDHPRRRADRRARPRPRRRAGHARGALRRPAAATPGWSGRNTGRSCRSRLRPSGSARSGTNCKQPHVAELVRGCREASGFSPDGFGR